MNKADREISVYRYQSYLIRIWQDGESALWRASARNAATGQLSLFDSLEHLFVYLHRQTKESDRA